MSIWCCNSKRLCKIWGSIVNICPIVSYWKWWCKSNLLCAIKRSFFIKIYTIVFSMSSWFIYIFLGFFWHNPDFLLFFPKPEVKSFHSIFLPLTWSLLNFSPSHLSSSQFFYLVKWKVDFFRYVPNLLTTFRKSWSFFFFCS